MNKRILISFIFLLSLQQVIFAHSLLLNVFDNEDNTITVEGVFNTGEVATGAQVRLEALANGMLLYKDRLPAESELTINIPKEAYQIVLDGGPGHQIIEMGPSPKGGFTKVGSQNKEVKLSEPREGSKQLSLALIVSIALAFVLLFITILVNIKNTNLLMKELQKVR